MNYPKAIQEAEKRIRPHILETPFYPSAYLSRQCGGQVCMKLESEQYTGSFKARGALNKILSLSKEEKSRGLVTASTGNHALGFARALAITGDRGRIFLPQNAVKSKIDALRDYGADLEFFGNNCLETELHAKKWASEHGTVWVSPYNDPLIIAGQGTTGLEIHRQSGGIDFLLACIGGGGLMSGIASWFKAFSPETKIIGCLPENSPEMYLSVKAGHIITLENPPDTLSDGSAGGMEEGSITFDLCRRLVDDYILVSEEEIAAAIKLIAEKHHKIIEGAAGVAVGAFLKEKDRFAGAKTGIVICGANIQTEKLKELL